MKKRKLIFVFILFTYIGKSQIQVPPAFFGLNEWFTDYTGAPFTSSLITAFSSTINARNSATGSMLMRVGGTAYNLYSGATPKYPSINTGSNSIVTPAGYVKIVDDVRNNGFEPMIEVPFDDLNGVKNLEEQAADAAAIVRAVNIVHKRNVRYWIIGNEPTNDYGYIDPMGVAEVRKVSTYLKKYSVEMKKVDPTIYIVGPELTSTYTAGLSPLFADPSTASLSVTGQIGSTFDGQSTGGASGKYYVDFASFHSYPGYSSVFTSTSNPIRQRYVDAVYGFHGEYLGTYTSCITTATYNSHVSLMITEFNMGTSSSGGSSLTATSIPQESLNANTFLAGQLVADMMGSMLTANCSASTTAYQNCNLWSCNESKDYAYTDGVSVNRKPTYWHYWLMSNYFKGASYKNLTTDPGQGNVGRCYRAYACKGSNYIAVLVMNQAQTSNSVAAIGDGSSSKSFTIDFNSGAADFSFGMGVSATYTSGSIPNKSTSLYFFDCSGVYQGQYDITEAAMTASPTTFTPQAVPSSTAIPIIPTLTVSGNNGCTGSTATITAPATATWYIGPDYVTSYTSGVSSITTVSAGIYAAKIAGSCSDYWLTAVVNQTSAILSRSSSSVENCSTSPTATISMDNGGGSYTYTWSAGLGNTYSANITATVDAAYTVTASLSGCAATETINLLACNSNTSTQDLWMEDDPSDTGSEPSSPPNGIYWNSKDMWIDPSSTLTGSDPGNSAEYKTDGTPNYIHVLVRNRGSSAASGKLNVYWTKATLGATFPNSWKDYFVPNGGVNVPAGDQIGAPLSVTVPSMSVTEYTIPWVVPNPSVYVFSPFDANALQHFCLYARIETGCGFTTAETGTMATDVLNNNNISQRNISVVNNNTTDIAPPRGYSVNILVPNTNTATIKTKFAITSYSNSTGNSMVSVGNPYVKLNDDLYSLWISGGSVGSNVSDVGDNYIKITGNSAYLDNINLSGSTLTALDARFTFTAQPVSTDTYFNVDIEQLDNSGASPVSLGGMRFVVYTTACPTISLVESTITAGSSCTINPAVSAPDAGAEFTWYDSGGSQVATAYTFSTVTGTSNTWFKVEEAYNGCVRTATCYVNISGSCGGRPAASTSNSISSASNSVAPTEDVGFGLKPNPTQDKTILTYNLDGYEKAELNITNAYGQIVMRNRLDTKETSFEINSSQFKNGLYYISIVSANKIVKTLKMIVMK